MFKVRNAWLAPLLAVILIGCGGGRESRQSAQPPTPDGKIMLEQIATTGDLSAHRDQLREELMGYGETDPELVEELLRDFEELTSLSDSQAIRAKAKEMAEKF